MRERGRRTIVKVAVCDDELSPIRDRRRRVSHAWVVAPAVHGGPLRRDEGPAHGTPTGTRVELTSVEREPVRERGGLCVLGTRHHHSRRGEGGYTAMMEATPETFEHKVQQQARRLVEQQRQLVVALQYGQLCERRIKQLAPGHALPLKAEMLDEPSAAGEADYSELLDAMRTRAERAEAENGLLRAAAAERRSEGGQARPFSAAASTQASRAKRLPTNEKSTEKAAPAGPTPQPSPPARRSGGGTIESLRVERAALQKALRESREEANKLREASVESEREARRAMEEAGRAAGLPAGAAQILREHAASERTISDLQAALRESEKLQRRAAHEAVGLRTSVEEQGDELELLGGALQEVTRRAEVAEQSLKEAEEAANEEGSGRSALVESYLELQAEAESMQSKLDRAREAAAASEERAAIAIDAAESMERHSAAQRLQAEAMRKTQSLALRSREHAQQAAVAAERAAAAEAAAASQMDSEATNRSDQLHQALASREVAVRNADELHEALMQNEADLDGERRARERAEAGWAASADHLRASTNDLNSKRAEIGQLQKALAEAEKHVTALKSGAALTKAREEAMAMATAPSGAPPSARLEAAEVTTAMARADAAEAALESARAEVVKVKEEQSIERKGLVSELHELHVQRAELQEKLHHGKLAALSATHDQQAMLAERSMEQGAARMQAQHVATIERQLSEAREANAVEAAAAERKLAAERALAERSGMAAQAATEAQAAATREAAEANAQRDAYARELASAKDSALATLERSLASAKAEASEAARAAAIVAWASTALGSPSKKSRLQPNYAGQKLRCHRFLRVRPLRPAPWDGVCVHA